MLRGIIYYVFFGWILKLVDTKCVEKEHSHNEKKHSHCEACLVLMKKRNLDTIHHYCKHTWWDHQFIHLRKFAVRRPTMTRYRKITTAFNLKMRQAEQIRVEGIRLYKMMQEVCAGEYDFRKTTPCLATVSIRGWEVDALIDSGTTVSLINESFLSSLDMNDEVTPWNMGPIQVANCNVLDIAGIVDVNILEQVGAVIDLDKNTLKLRGCKPVELVGRLEILEVSNSLMAVYAIDYTWIPAKTEMVVPVRIENTDEKQ